MSCGKRAWATQSQANAGLHSIWRSGFKGGPHKLPTRAYKCDKCPKWHITSQPPKGKS